MKSDINFPKVEGISVAVTREKNEVESYEWNVYLMNTGDKEISNILIASRGYGEVGGKEKKTSVIRQHIEKMDANTFVKIEPIMPELFELYNEYWISYYIDKTIFDKKFIFVPQSIAEQNISEIPFLGLEGVLHG